MSSVRSGGPWNINERDFPHNASRAEQFGFLLQYAILAPSTRNTQPWKFRISGDTVDILIDTVRWQRVSDGDRRELHISAGCALENIVVAARHFGFAPVVAYLPDSANAELAARVVMTPSDREPAPEIHDLFVAIRRRFTNHGAYDGVRVTERDLETVRSLATEPGLELVWATDAPTLHRTDELLMRADALLLSDPAYRHELGALIGGGAFGTPWLLALLGRFAVSYITPIKSFVEADHAALVSSPALGLISAAANTREAQVRTGQMLERIYLLADNLGLNVQPVSQLMQAAEVRETLSDLLARGRVPLQPFRLGYAKPPKTFTPRRSLADVLVQ